MRSWETSAHTIHTIKVPVEGDLKSVNFYLIRTNQQLILLDAGWTGDTYWKALQQSLIENGYSIDDITCVILTHHHIDHCGLINQLIEIHNIPVYAHKKSIPRLKRNKEFLHNRVQFFENLYREYDCGEKGKKHVEQLYTLIKKNHHHKINTDIIPIDNLDLPLFETFHFPGHAPDHIGLWDKEEGVLFGGDILIKHISSNAIVEPDENGRMIPTLLQYIETLKSIAALPVHCVYPGHGSVIENPQVLIKKRLKRIEKKGERIISLIENGETTGRKIAQRYYKEVYDEQFFLVMSEIVGQLDYLERQGKVTKEFVNGVWKFSQPHH